MLNISWTWLLISDLSCALFSHSYSFDHVEKLDSSEFFEQSAALAKIEIKHKKQQSWHLFPSQYSPYNKNKLNHLDFLKMKYYKLHWRIVKLQHPEFHLPSRLGCRIHRMQLCKGVTPPSSVLDMILTNLMVRFQ